MHLKLSEAQVQKHHFKHNNDVTLEKHTVKNPLPTSPTLTLFTSLVEAVLLHAGTRQCVLWL